MAVSSYVVVLASSLLMHDDASNITDNKIAQRLRGLIIIVKIQVKSATKVQIIIHKISYLRAGGAFFKVCLHFLLHKKAPASVALQGYF